MPQRGSAIFRSLDLGETGVTDAGLERLTESTNLERMDPFGTRVTDAGLTHLRRLKNSSGSVCRRG